VTVRIALAGSVSFSRRALQALVRHGADIVGVLGLDESASKNVSDFAPLDDVAAAVGAPHRGFTKINAPEVVEQLAAWKPDVLFVVGLSQLVDEKIMAIPRLGSVGFHPTRLPEGRGRAPVAWLTHDGRDGAATFFVLEQDADSGAIFVQEPYHVVPGMYGAEVIEEVRAAIDRGLDRWLPKLIAGEWQATPQDEARASFWGKRAPEDGLIDWSRPAEEIARLVRTASRPYPGAYTYARDAKLVVWRASVSDLPFRGVPGRILQRWTDGRALVQCGSGLLMLEDCEREDREAVRLTTGQRLGYAAEDEINRLKREIAELRRLLAERQ
jgi:methionyl-tRNA formyltransferase